MIKTNNYHYYIESVIGLKSVCPIYVKSRRLSRNNASRDRYTHAQKQCEKGLFKLAVDASDTGAGSVLMQEDGNGVDHPVSYFSKKFNKYQKNYSTIEKECLSLILALQHFEVYLTSSSSPTVVFSDHSPLTFFHKMKNKNQRLLRWSLLFQEYNLDIRHIKGKDNIISDALSRA